MVSWENECKKSWHKYDAEDAQEYSPILESSPWFISMHEEVQKARQDIADSSWSCGTHYWKDSRKIMNTKSNKKSAHTQDNGHHPLYKIV